MDTDYGRTAYHPRSLSSLIESVRPLYERILLPTLVNHFGVWLWTRQCAAALAACVEYQRRHIQNAFLCLSIINNGTFFSEGVVRKYNLLDMERDHRDPNFRLPDDENLWPDNHFNMEARQDELYRHHRYLLQICMPFTRGYDIMPRMLPIALRGVTDVQGRLIFGQQARLQCNDHIERHWHRDAETRFRHHRGFIRFGQYALLPARDLRGVTG